MPLIAARAFRQPNNYRGIGDGHLKVKREAEALPADNFGLSNAGYLGQRQFKRPTIKGFKGVKSGRVVGK